MPSHRANHFQTCHKVSNKHLPSFLVNTCFPFCFWKMCSRTHIGRFFVISTSFTLMEPHRGCPFDEYLNLPHNQWLRRKASSVGNQRKMKRCAPSKQHCWPRKKTNDAASSTHGAWSFLHTNRGSSLYDVHELHPISSAQRLY